MDIVSVRTLDEITLKGLLIPSSNESDRVCLFIPGCCGNFVDNDFILTISKILSNNNYNVLCANTRGSFMINSSFHPLNTERPKQIGTTFETFEDSRYDIEAWIKYLENLGYKNIDLICHSSGCNKVIYYLNSKMEGINNINNLVLLSPPDFVNRIKCYEDYKDLLVEAKNNVENGETNKLVKVHFFYKTSISFLEMMASKNFDNMPLVNGTKEDFYQYSNIDKPITVIYGSLENFIKNYIYKLKEYSKNKDLFESYEIDGADHIYFDRDKEVGEKIVESLNKRYKDIKVKKLIGEQNEI